VTDFLGGGLVFGVAAVLWVAYLIPSWMRRRNFIAAESNAVRMQQTIRALVETQDAPTEVDAELSSRGLHAQRRKLHEAEAAARAKLRAAQKAAHEKPARAAMSPEQAYALSAHRRRTLRIATFIFFLLALMATAAGVALVMYTGMPALIFIGAGALAAALLTFRVLASAGRRAQEQLRHTPRVVSETRVSEPSSAAVSQPNPRAWSPTQLPEAMHLKPGSVAAGTIAAADAAARIRRAALEEAYRAQTEHSRPRAFPAVARSLPDVDAIETEIHQSDADTAGGRSAIEGWNLDDIYRRRAAG